MNSFPRQQEARRRAGYLAALTVAAAVCVLSTLLALLWFIKALAQDGPETLVQPAQVLALVQQDAEAVLQTAVQLEPLRELPVLRLPPGAVELRVRYPKRSGCHVPEAVECYVDGRLVTSLPLGQYLRFSLNVLVAAENIPARTPLDAAPVALSAQVVNAGAEVAVSPAQVAGLAARGMLPAGARVLLSRLMRPYDVARGSIVLLVIAVDGVRLEAQAKALADAYVGQRLTVEREGDKRKYNGLVCPGQRVVVE